MCGIIGFVGPQNTFALHKMADRIQHRGPDDSGFYYCPVNNVSLGHRRLSIVDIDNGSQPMWNDNKSIGIVFNGEIYNHMELRHELLAKGHIFKTDHSDTEMLIHGYKEWGSDLLNRLNGMFAFCIYDRFHKRLFCARDRFGKKPFYYTQFNNQFVFASELKALSEHPCTGSEINPISVQKYFGYGFIPGPLSLYKNVFKLPSGHYMYYDIPEAKLSIFKYWQFSLKPDYNYLQTPENDLAEELRELLISAVKLRMVADVPIGVFLSGGVDSSTILACASQVASHGRIKTFSIGFHEKEFDESNVAKKIASIFGTNHTEEKFSIEVARKSADHVLSLLDEPMGDSSILPTYLLSFFAKKSITVALSGDGGDEIFAGYAPFHALKWAQLYCRALPAWLRNFILKQTNRLPASEGYLSLDFKLKRTLQGLQYPQSIWHPMWLSPLSPNEISDLTGTRVEWEEIYSEAIEAWQSSTAEDLIGRSIEFYARFYLQDGVLTKVDRASMMVGLEVRSPFLDNHVVDFAMRLPSHFKYRNGISKYLLKKSMKGILPNDLLYRPKKGFGIPLTKWLKDWPIAIDHSLGFNHTFIKKLQFEHHHGYRDNRLFLWNLYTLSKHLK